MASIGQRFGSTTTQDGGWLSTCGRVGFSTWGSPRTTQYLGLSQFDRRLSGWLAPQAPGTGGGGYPGFSLGVDLPIAPGSRRRVKLATTPTRAWHLGSVPGLFLVRPSHEEAVGQRGYNSRQGWAVDLDWLPENGAGLELWLGGSKVRRPRDDQEPWQSRRRKEKSSTSCARSPVSGTTPSARELVPRS